MKGNDYWRERFELLQDAQMHKSEEFLKSLEQEYKQAAKKVQNDIEIWFSRLADNNGVSLAEARKLLAADELQEFKWSVEQYIKYGEENAVNQKWVKELENASARVHINQLEARLTDIQQTVESLYTGYLSNTGTALGSIYTEGYFRSAFEIQKGINTAWDLPGINQKRLEAVLSKPWTADGLTFSDRIWKQKNELLSSLRTELTQGLMRGDAPDKAIANIAERFDVAKNQAGRLVMTESAYFSSVSQRDCFNDLDVERYQIVATLDMHTSVRCQGLDGKIYDMKIYEPNVTAPPFHCWCRTTTVPYFEDNDGERIARGADGKTYYVPADMTYQEWKTYILHVANEPKITNDMRSVVSKTNGELHGLEYRIKTTESFITKVKTDVKTGQTQEHVLNHLYDTVRYTITANKEKFTSNFNETVYKLKKIGYNTIRVKNTLADKNAAYRGVNTIVESPSGFKFELQYHTIASFEIKQKNHILYEKTRSMDTSKEDIASLYEEMKKSSKSIEVPIHCEDIKSFDKIK